MIRLLCINSSPYFHASGIFSTGNGLVEGEIYTADETILIHPHNKKPCYFIRELNDLKLVVRFIPLSDRDESEKDYIEVEEVALTEDL